MARLYNKTEELRSQHAPDSEKTLTEIAHWRKNGWDASNDVWRLEVQVRSKPLEELGARAPRHLAERLDPIWQYAFGELGAKKQRAWLRLINVASATRSGAVFARPTVGAVSAGANRVRQESAGGSRTRIDTGRFDRASVGSCSELPLITRRDTAPGCVVA